MRRHLPGFPLFPVFPLFLFLFACNLPSLSPVRRFTPTPSRTLSVTTSAPAQTTPRPPTETPLGIFAPTGTPTLDLTETETATSTPTATSESSAPAGAPLTIADVRLVGVRRDPARDNGAIATIEILFSGGAPPYTFTDENQFKPGNPFEVPATCAADLVHTATVSSADGQTASKPYFASINCPP